MPGATSRCSIVSPYPRLAPTYPAHTMPPRFALATGQPFGVYVHVPWCASRCGYCDFNTYVPRRVRGAGPSAFAATAIAEAALMRAALGGAAPPADTVFLGGGTPTLLPPGELAQILGAIERAPGAEVTVE